MTSTLFANRQLNIPTNPDQLRVKLTTEPDAIVNFLVNNNPEGIADNLDALGMGRMSSKVQIRQALTYLLQKNPTQFVRAVNVKIDPSTLSAEEMNVLRNLSDGRNERSSRQPDLNYGTPPPSMGGPAPTQGSSSAGTDEHWSDIATNLGNTVVGLINAIQGTPAAPGAGVDPGAGGVPTKDNTWMWVGIGVAVLIVTTVVILIFRKKSK